MNIKENILSIIILSLCILPLASPLLPSVPGIYFGNFCRHSDKIQLGTINGPSYAATSAGYNFTITWTRTIANIYASCLSLYNFQLEPYKYLSLQTEIVASSSSGATINMNPIESGAGIKYLAYSIILITQQSNYI